MAPAPSQQHGAMPRNASTAAASSAPQHTTAIAIGVGVGAAILLACAFITLRIIRARRAHRRAIAALEDANGVPGTLRHDMAEMARPVSRCSASRFRPLNIQWGWDALCSNDTINEPLAVAQSGKGNMSTASVPTRVKSRGVPLRPFKHLSAIIESPRTQQDPLPALPQRCVAEIASGLPHSNGNKDGVCGDQKTDNVFGTAPDSPKLAVMPSFAIRSPGQHGVAVASDSHKAKVPRSVSTGVLTDYRADGAVFGSEEPMPNMSKRRGPPLHIRTVSLGAPPSRPPPGPVPPLPVLSPLETDFEKARKGVCISRMSSSSSSSSDSTSSSVLVTSPILERSNNDDPVASPTVDEVVDDENGALRTVAKNQWQNPPHTDQKPTSNMKAGRHARARSSVRGRIVRSSTDSALTHLRQASSSSISSCGSGHNRLSIPQLGTAERISLSRVSSSNSLTPAGVQKITTPPKRARRQSSVSAYGSPAERRRASALRDICGNAVVRKNTPTREPSQSTINSGRSSNGNPFHWDTQSSNILPKPSALKGSPNARKGHKRQKSCVRISTLTPEVLGPAPTSPAALMDKIKEERESEEVICRLSQRETSMYLARSAKPPSASASIDNLRVQTLRASLTPSSPTLSTWNAYQETSGLPSQHSDSNMTNLTVSPMNISRTASRQSDRSFSIPKFPSPARKSRATMSLVAIDTSPMPEFVLACPVSDEADETHNSLPFALDMSSEEATPVDIPSSPPLPLSKSQEYDPGWPMITFAPTTTASGEYDPASPPSTMVHGEGEAVIRSSLFLPFAVSNVNHSDINDDVSPRSRPTLYAGAPVGANRDPAIHAFDSPPCSPKTVPRHLDTSADIDVPIVPPKNPRREAKREQQQLTSENASTYMARSKVAPQLGLGFPGAIPVLAPTSQYDEDQDLPRWPPSCVDDKEEVEEQEITPRAENTGMRLAKPPSLSTIPQSSSSPLQSPATLKNSAPRDERKASSIMGPRAAPAQSVLKNALALRRMNSEVNCHRSRESRTYVRLGREPSLLLPWIGSQNDTHDDEERSQSDLFDFEFNSNQSTPSHLANSVMDEIDLEAFDKHIDGALKGFEAEFHAYHGSKPVSVRRNSSKENEQPSDDTFRKSSVWDDGEHFWQSGQSAGQENDSRPETSGSLIPAYTHAKQLTPGINESTSLDPRFLSTPRGESHDVQRLRGSSPMGAIGSVAATPKSLYDADGFLRT